jgi:hypothetical protein
MTPYRHVTTLVAALALLGLAGSIAVAEEHPRLHVALYELRHARTDLKNAGTNFGGHKKAALEALNDAIKQVEEALEAVDDNTKGTDPGKDTYKNYANFPHIRHALAAAKDAREELKEAAHTYKGHRAAAVKALDSVVDELKEAIRFAKDN